MPKRNFGLILVAVECIQKRIWETSTDKPSRSDIAHDLGAMTLGLLACRPEWAGRVCVWGTDQDSYFWGKSNNAAPCVDGHEEAISPRERGFGVAI